MEKNRQRVRLSEDNRGATLLIVMAVFLFLTVIASNIIMFVNSANNTVNIELETSKQEMYVMSIYEVLNSRMLEGEWNDAFVRGMEVRVDVNGFKDEENEEIPVEISINLSKNNADVYYYITYGGNQFSIHSQYSFIKTGENTTITLKKTNSCVRVN